MQHTDTDEPLPRAAHNTPGTVRVLRTVPGDSHRFSTIFGFYGIFGIPKIFFLNIFSASVPAHHRYSDVCDLAAALAAAFASALA